MNALKRKGFYKGRTILEAENGTIDLKPLFFEVDSRSLYWEKSPEFMGIAPLVKKCTPRFFAILSLDDYYVFSTVTDKYVLIRNDEAFDLGYDLAQRIFHIKAKEDFVCVHAEMTATRGACMMDMKRRIGIYQPLMNEGWCAFMRIWNSYNKTRTLQYDMGFYNVELGIGILDSDISITVKTPHYSSFGSFQHKFIKQVEKKNYNIEVLEQRFLDKINSLRRIDVSWQYILPLFCCIYKLGVIKNPTSAEIADLIKLTEYIDWQAKMQTEKYGQNAYALLNVFAMYESQCRNPFMKSYNKFILGKWVNDLIGKSKSADFTLADYVGSKAFNTANWLRTLDANKVGDKRE